MDYMDKTITPFSVPQGVTKGVIMVKDNTNGMKWAFDTVQQVLDFSKSYAGGELKAEIAWIQHFDYTSTTG